MKSGGLIFSVDPHQNDNSALEPSQANEPLCHGDDEQAVFEELCRIVDEAIALYEKDGKPLPPPTSGSDFANRMQRVV
jgi:hypothetical protein